jgi:hypothetical protein
LIAIIKTSSPGNEIRESELILDFLYFSPIFRSYSVTLNSAAASVKQQEGFLSKNWNNACIIPAGMDNLPSQHNREQEKAGY